MHFKFFDGIGIWPQGLALTKQAIYCFSHPPVHTSSPHLRGDLGFETFLFRQLSVIAHQFIKQLKLFILNKRMKIE
jgi:hypothetical protein